MPYKNIVYAKLEKRLLNDPRWYMMTEEAQLNFIRLLLVACETYNRIPKNVEALRLAFKTKQDATMIESTLTEIKRNFPKFKANKYFYYFDGFDEKTNYVSPKERRGKSQVNPKEGA